MFESSLLLGGATRRRFIGGWRGVLRIDVTVLGLVGGAPRRTSSILLVSYSARSFSKRFQTIWAVKMVQAQCKITRAFIDLYGYPLLGLDAKNAAQRGPAGEFSARGPRRAPATLPAALPRDTPPLPHTKAVVRASCRATARRHARHKRPFFASPRGRTHTSFVAAAATRQHPRRRATASTRGRTARASRPSRPARRCPSSAA